MVIVLMHRSFVEVGWLVRRDGGEDREVDSACRLL